MACAPWALNLESAPWFQTRKSRLIRRGQAQRAVSAKSPGPVQQTPRRPGTLREPGPCLHWAAL